MEIESINSLGSARIGTALLTLVVACPLLMASWTWRERASLPRPRGGYGAGERDHKLVIGGGTYWEDGKKLMSARTDIFDPATNTWTAGPPLPAARGNGACATLNDALYLLGGTLDGEPSANVVRLDAHGWKQVPAGLPQALELPVATSAGNFLYVFGGLTKAGDLTSATRTFIRGNAAGGWKSMAAFPGKPRVTAAFTALGDKLYVFGGVEMIGTEVRNLADAWAYDIPSDRWDRIPSPPVSRRAWGTAVEGKSILLAGGFSDTFSAEVYAYDTVTAKYTLAGSLPHPIADAKFVAINGKLYTTGGEPDFKVRAAWTIEGSR